MALAFSLAQGTCLPMLIPSTRSHYQGAKARAFVPTGVDLREVVRRAKQLLSGLAGAPDLGPFPRRQGLLHVPPTHELSEV